MHDIWPLGGTDGLHLRLNAFKERPVIALLPEFETFSEFVVCATPPRYVRQEEPPHDSLEPTRSGVAPVHGLNVVGS